MSEYSIEKGLCRCNISHDDGWEHYQVNICGRCKTIEERVSKLSFMDKIRYYLGIKDIWKTENNKN